MALTTGQIESFSLISFNRVSKERQSYVKKVLTGLNNFDKDKYFYRINGMLSVIWLYNTNTTTNCLTVAQITTIMNKLNFELGLNICLDELPETFLNIKRDFRFPDFNPLDFA
jgi:hypothetical protein